MTYKNKTLLHYLSDGNVVGRTFIDPDTGKDMLLMQSLVIVEDILI